MVDASQVQRWLNKLREGTLTEQDLEMALADLKQRGNGASPRQKLLYLQTHSTAVDSPVNGMSIVEGGEVRLPPENYEDWPYHTVLDALEDGWRVVKFPELSLLYDHPDEVDRWMGCEFILEK